MKQSQDQLARRLLLACCLLGAFAWCAPLRAADREVGSGKTYATILAAITAAESGDRIVVYGGEYTDMLHFGKSLEIVAAAGENPVYRAATDAAWHIFIPGDYNFQGPSVTVIWDGIDIVFDTDSSIGMLFGSHPTKCNFTFRNMSLTDTANAHSLAYGPFCVYRGSSMTLENVTIDLPHAASQIGVVFATDAAQLPNDFAEITLNNCTVNALVRANQYLLGGQHQLTNWTLNNSSFSAPAQDGEETYYLMSGHGAKAETTLGASTTRFTINQCTFNGASGRIGGMGVMINNMTANRTLFSLNTGTDNQASGDTTAGDIPWQQSYTNCVFHLGGTAPSLLTVPATALTGSLTLRQCTVVATTPSADATLVNYLPESVAATLTLENNLFALPDSNLGIVGGAGKAQVAVTAGTNLRYYGSGTGATGDALTGTKIDGAPQLQPDNIHLFSDSPGVNAGENLAGITQDYDGDPRPFGVKSDLGADEIGEVVNASGSWIHYD